MDFSPNFLRLINSAKLSGKLQQKTFQMHRLLSAGSKINLAPAYTSQIYSVIDRTFMPPTHSLFKLLKDDRVCLNFFRSSDYLFTPLLPERMAREFPYSSNYTQILFGFRTKIDYQEDNCLNHWKLSRELYDEKRWFCVQCRTEENSRYLHNLSSNKNSEAC